MCRAHPWTTDNEGLVFKCIQKGKALQTRGLARTEPQQQEEAVDSLQVTWRGRGGGGFPAQCVFFPMNEHVSTRWELIAGTRAPHQPSMNRLGMFLPSGVSIGS